MEIIFIVIKIIKTIPALYACVTIGSTARCHGTLDTKDTGGIRCSGSQPGGSGVPQGLLQMSV